MADILAGDLLVHPGAADMVAQLAREATSEEAFAEWAVTFADRVLADLEERRLAMHHQLDDLLSRLGA